MPGQLNLQMVYGDTFQTTLTWNSGGSPVNLTGWTATVTIKSGLDPSARVFFTGTSTGASPAIVLGGAAGTISITIPYETVKQFPIGQNLVYSLALVNTNVTPNAVTTLVAGSVNVTPVATVIA